MPLEYKIYRPKRILNKHKRADHWFWTRYTAHPYIIAELREAVEDRVIAGVRGLELGGSSEMAFVHLDGSEGDYQESFQVKGRKGNPCFVCATPIERAKVSGRGTYFCPRCQTSCPSF